MIEPYQPPAVGNDIDLDLSRNEGRPVDPELHARVATTAGIAHRYPDTSELRDAIAELRGVNPERVLITAGGDDALFRSCAALIMAGTRVVTTTPTFEMVTRYSGLHQPDLVEVPWKDERFPLGAVTTAGAEGAVCIVVSPNNPTGEVIDAADLTVLAAAFEFVVLDGAYTEFADVDLTATALSLANVLMIRTLSKAWGLAGLRVGYLLGEPTTVKRIAAYGNPYPVARISLAVAAERIRSNDGVDAYVAEVKRERSDLTGFLQSRGLLPIPSRANFVYFDDADPQRIAAELAAAGIAIRTFPERSGLEEAVRVTLPGDADEYDRLVDALASALKTKAMELNP
ncbi:MAG: pyridoxal phosphate-dependent aminotransferase [Acidimicrobiia bacterium]